MRKNAYKVLANQLIKNPQVALVYADQLISRIKNEKCEEVKENIVIHFPEYNHIKQLERCIIGSQPMWRSSLHFQDDIWFNEKYEVSGDHEFQLKVAEKYEIIHLHEPLGTFYKSVNYTNKEYENIERNIKEVNEIREIFMNNFISKLSHDQLNNYRKSFSIYVRMPILLYVLLKKIERLVNNNIYPRFFFHSVEFVYQFNIQILIKLNDTKSALKQCDRFLFYKKSMAIQRLKQLIISKNEEKN